MEGDISSTKTCISLGAFSVSIEINLLSCYITLDLTLEWLLKCQLNNKIPNLKNFLKTLEVRQNPRFVVVPVPMSLMSPSDYSGILKLEMVFQDRRM